MGYRWVKPVHEILVPVEGFEEVHGHIDLRVNHMPDPTKSRGQYLGLLELCRAGDIPVSRGAGEPLADTMRTAEDTHGPAGLGYAELPTHSRELTSYDSAEAWVRAAHARPGELIGLVTGPLTNLALAVRADPQLPTLLRRLVIMGGSFDYRGNTTPVAEWNISVDPEAAAEVFAAWGRAVEANAIEPHQLPIVCGLNLTENIALTPAILSRLAGAAGSSTVAMSVLDTRGTRSVADNPLTRSCRSDFVDVSGMSDGPGQSTNWSRPES